MQAHLAACLVVVATLTGCIGDGCPDSAPDQHCPAPPAPADGATLAAFNTATWRLVITEFVQSEDASGHWTFSNEPVADYPDHVRRVSPDPQSECELGCDCELPPAELVDGTVVTTYVERCGTRELSCSVGVGLGFDGTHGTSTEVDCTETGHATRTLMLTMTVQ